MGFLGANADTDIREKENSENNMGWLSNPCDKDL